MLRFVVALSLLLVSGPLAAVERCEDGAAPWPWIGVDVLQCPGGSCDAAGLRISVDAARKSVKLTGRGSSSRFYDFATEPRLRRVAPDGPAAGVVEDGDVLVAVNGYLITSPRGGDELASLPFDRDATLTLRRADRLLDVTVRPAPRCGPALAVAADSDAFDGEVDTGRDAVIARGYVGLGLECEDCRFSLTGLDVWTGVPALRKVVRVERGGIADRAGLREGDVLLSVDGRSLERASGNERLFSALLGQTGEMSLLLRYVRDGVEAETVLRVPGRPEKSSRRKIPRHGIGALARMFGGLGDGSGTARLVGMTGSSWGNGHLGMLIRWCDGCSWEVLADGFRWNLTADLEILEVKDGGPADRAGLRAGDVITHVNGNDVTSDEAGRLLVLTNQRGKKLKLRYLRGGLVADTTLVTR